MSATLSTAATATTIQRVEVGAYADAAAAHDVRAPEPAVAAP